MNLLLALFCHNQVEIRPSLFFLPTGPGLSSTSPANKRQYFFKAVRSPSDALGVIMVRRALPLPLLLSLSFYHYCYGSVVADLARMMSPGMLPGTVP